MNCNDNTRRSGKKTLAMSEAGKINCVIGFDYGQSRVGVACGQIITATATPVTTINATTKEHLFSEIDKLVKEWQPDVMVVGVPVHMDGEEQEVTRLAKKFINRLQARYSLPVYEIDERLSSYEADAILSENSRSYKKNKKSQKAGLDMVAAQLITESWMRDWG